jgi:predicted enzyme related to lactoylglutathione lyase
MTTLDRISYIKLLVRDLDAALKWYTEELGFEVRADYSLKEAGQWALIGLRDQPDLSVALECPDMRVHGPDLYSTLAARIGKGTALVLTTPDCRSAYRELVGRGVRVLSEPSDLPWGVSMLIEDPDGNGIALLEPAERPKGLRRQCSEWGSGSNFESRTSSCQPPPSAL